VNVHLRSLLLNFLSPGAVGVAIVLTLSVVAQAGESIYSNLDCAITFPYGWQMFPVEQTNVFALVKSFDGARSIVLRANHVDRDRWSEVDEDFRRDGKRAFEREGVLTLDMPVTMAGLPGWEFGGHVWFEGKRVSTVSRILIAGGTAYKINILFMDGDAGSDPTLRKCLESFRLLRPVNPAPKHMSRRATKLVEVVSFLSVPVGLLVALAYVFRRRRRPTL